MEDSDLPRIVWDSEKREDHLVFIDETGFMMTPTIRRTFAAPGRRRSIRSLTLMADLVIGAVSISPIAQAAWLALSLIEGQYELPGARCRRVLEVLVSGSGQFLDDYLGLHHYSLVRCRRTASMATHPGIVTEFFPPCAPELNPVDRAWFYIKYDRLPNFTPATTVQLRSAVERELKVIRTNPLLLRSFIHHSGLSLDF